MTRESNFWRTVRKGLAPFGLLVRIEDRLRAGTPDVTYCLTLPGRPPSTGWVELKYIPAIGVRGKVDLRFTEAQLDWHTAWATHSGRSFLLAKVERRVFLLRGSEARVGSVPWGYLDDADLLMGAGARKFPAREVAVWLSK